MIDASHHPYEEMCVSRPTAVKLAHSNGVVVEAELGMLGASRRCRGLDAEEYEKNVGEFLTDPIQAADFYKRTNIDSLARRHRHQSRRYKFKHEAKLAFNRIETDYEDLSGLPLVMHGSSSGAAGIHRTS